MTQNHSDRSGVDQKQREPLKLDLSLSENLVLATLQGKAHFSKGLQQQQGLPNSRAFSRVPLHRGAVLKTD